MCFLWQTLRLTCVKYVKYYTTTRLPVWPLPRVRCSMYGPTQCVADSSSEWFVCEAISLETQTHLVNTPLLLFLQPQNHDK